MQEKEPASTINRVIVYSMGQVFINSATFFRHLSHTPKCLSILILNDELDFTLPFITLLKSFSSGQLLEESICFKIAKVVNIPITINIIKNR